MSNIKYRPDIDGLRAVAVLSVIIYHAFPSIITGGFVGVDVFFVISGYLISGIIIKSIKSGSFSFLDFYSRRIKRIFPSLMLMLISVFIAGYFIMMPSDYANLGKHIISSALSFQNLMLLSESGYFDSSSELKPLLHIWSLGVEEQFYLLWPIALIIIYKYIKKPVIAISIISLLSFVLCVFYSYKDISLAFYFPIFRLWELSAGAILYSFLDKESNKLRNGTPDIISLTAILVISYSLFNINSSDVFPGFLALLPVIASVLIIGFCRDSILSRRVLSDSRVVYIGKISYPLYIWHWPLLSFFYYASPQLNGTQDTIARICLLVASFILASLTYHLIENKIRYTKGNKSKICVMSLCVVTFFVCMLGLSAYMTNGFIDRYGDKIKAISGTIDFKWKEGVRGDVCHIMGDIDDKHLSGNRANCVSVDKHQIFLWGDSHAGALYPGVEYLALQKGYSVSQITGAKRVPMSGISSIADQQYVEAMKYITSIKPQIIMLDARWTVHGKYNEVFSHLKNTIDDIKRASPDSVIYIVGPAPEWTQNLQNSLYNMATSGNFMPKYSKDSLNNYVISFDKDFSKLVSSYGVRYISLTSSLCNESGCITNINGSPQSISAIDYGHLSKPAAIYALSGVNI